MKRDALTTATSAWALVAYLGFLLLAAPCTCFAQPAPDATPSVCCCGPDAATPCAPSSESGGHQGCDADLGAGCAQALPEAQAADTVTSAGESALPAPTAVLGFELASPEASLLSSARARAPSTPAPRLDQVRSTVLLI